jgi:hypothetical protein
LKAHQEPARLPFGEIALFGQAESLTPKDRERLMPARDDPGRS